MNEWLKTKMSVETLGVRAHRPGMQGKVSDLDTYWEEAKSTYNELPNAN